MTKTLKKLTWLDWVFLLGIAAFFYYVANQVEANLRYNWNWSIIPNYVLRWEEKTSSWVSNLLLQGFVTTIRISIYGSVLALLFGVILGLARVSNNLVIRMLARTYAELRRDIPAIVIIFIFHFFLADQIMPILGAEEWARGIPKEDLAFYEFFYGDMRHFPSLLSGIIVIAMFESAFVGEIIRAGIQSIGRSMMRISSGPGSGIFV